MSGRFDVKSGYGEIRLKDGTKDGPRVRVLAADATTADGVIPTLALVDELHRHPSGELYGVFMDGLGPRDGRMITISTAGATQDSPLGLLRKKALELEGCLRDEARSTRLRRRRTGVRDARVVARPGRRRRRHGDGEAGEPGVVADGGGVAPPA
jgi:hypothetical protein